MIQKFPWFCGSRKCKTYQFGTPAFYCIPEVSLEVRFFQTYLITYQTLQARAQRTLALACHINYYPGDTIHYSWSTASKTLLTFHPRFPLGPLDLSMHYRMPVRWYLLTIFEYGYFQDKTFVILQALSSAFDSLSACSNPLKKPHP
jgi:hypothetical protein